MERYKLEKFYFREACLKKRPQTIRELLCVVFKQQSDRVTYFLLTLMAFFFAGAFHAGKIGMAIATPAALVFTRFLIASIFLLPFLLRQPKENYLPRKEDLPLLCLLGLTGIFLYNYLFFKALATTSAVNAAVLGSLGPLLTSLMAAAWGKERLGFLRLGALLLALFGVLLALCNGNWGMLIDMRFNSGDLYMLAAVLFLSIYNVASKKALQRFNPLSVLFLSMIVGVAISAPLFLFERPWETLPFRSLPFWAAVSYMGICASAGGFLFLQTGIRNIGVNRSIPFVNLTAVFTILIALLVHGQAAITWAQAAAAAAIISGVLINSRMK